MAEDEFDLCGFEPCIDRDRGQAGFEKSIKKLDGRDGVRPTDGHAIARFEALFEEPFRKRRDGFIERLVRDFGIEREERGLTRESFCR